MLHDQTASIFERYSFFFNIAYHCKPKCMSRKMTKFIGFCIHVGSVSNRSLNERFMRSNAVIRNQYSGDYATNQFLISIEIT